MSTIYILFDILSWNDLPDWLPEDESLLVATDATPDFQLLVNKS